MTAHELLTMLHTKRARHNAAALHLKRQGDLHGWRVETDRAEEVNAEIRILLHPQRLQTQRNENRIRQ